MPALPSPSSFDSLVESHPGKDKLEGGSFIMQKEQGLLTNSDYRATRLYMVNVQCVSSVRRLQQGRIVGFLRPRTQGTVHTCVKCLDYMLEIKIVLRYGDVENGVMKTIER